jgi:hypothetical protein
MLGYRGPLPWARLASPGKRFMPCTVLMLPGHTEPVPRSPLQRDARALSLQAPGSLRSPGPRATRGCSDGFWVWLTRQTVGAFFTETAVSTRPWAFRRSVRKTRRDKTNPLDGDTLTSGTEQFPNISTRGRRHEPSLLPSLDRGPCTPALASRRPDCSGGATRAAPEWWPRIPDGVRSGPMTAWFGASRPRHYDARRAGSARP